MRRVFALVPCLSLIAAACQSTPSRDVVEGDPAVRQSLLQAVAGLQGRWQNADPAGDPMTIDFQVTSGGSAVREVMFPGHPHEMTNMYALDGSALAMTHFCAEGNQPRMRATALDGNRLAFRFDGVSDLKATDQLYMGEMTLVLVDADHIEQHWRAFKSGALDHEAVFRLAREK